MRQRSKARGQRVWNLQPGGGFTGLGTSPERMMRFRALRVIDTRADFLRVKPRMLRVGEVKTFENFVVPLAEAVDLTAYNTVAIWCERFQMFITASTYR